MIDVSKIRIPRNYVLIAPDADYDTIQHKGLETDLYTANYIVENGKRVSVESKNYSVHGTVYGVPDKIGFYKDEINDIKRDKTKEQVVLEEDTIKRLSDYVRRTCLFETENELQIGDRVKFSYLAHVKVKEEGGIFETTQGPMYFIKYDQIFMAVNEDLSPKKMVNGYILVEPELKESKKDGIMDYTETSTGLIIPTLNDQKLQKRTRKNMIGKVLCAGNPIKRYFQFDIEDRDVHFNPGDTVIFDPRGAKRLEHPNHQEYSDHELFLIQQRDVYINKSENANFDLIEIERKVS